MPTALIVEDEPLLRAELRDKLAALWPELALAGEAGNGVEAMRMVHALQPDVLFLDIQMPGIDGLAVARQAPPTTQIVFVTAFPEHALGAFDAGAIDYLVKPITMARLAATVNRLRDRAPAAPPAAQPATLAAPVDRGPRYIKWIKASSGDTFRLVIVDDVVLFQSDGKYTRVVSSAGDALIRTPLKELIAQLDPEQFAQVHRSMIVNLREIDRLERDGAGMLLRLRGRRDTYPVSEMFARQFRQM
jgi:DNA-binding LytR/AlgR family response regulator